MENGAHLSGSCSSARTDFRFEVLSSSRGCRLCAAIALSAAQYGRGNSEAIHDPFIESCIDRSITSYSIDPSSSYRDCHQRDCTDRACANRGYSEKHRNFQFNLDRAAHRTAAQLRRRRHDLQRNRR